MHDFKYINNELYCEKVKVADIIKKVGSPAYIYSHKTFVEHIRKLQAAFKSVKPLICYSMKANSNLAILKAVVNEGAGLDIVSGGELYRAKKVKCPAERIVFAGVGKTEREIEDAIRYGILFFNVESLPELELIQKVARRLKCKASVSIRVNPNVDPRTHRYIATGKKESKFGIDLGLAEGVFSNTARYPNIELCAIHCHIGSQIVSGEPFVEAFKKVAAFIDEIEKKYKVKIKYLNLGGGLGVIYSNEKPQTAAQYARNILPIFKGKKYRLVFEPGRFVSANGGILVGQVIYVKRTQVKNFAIVDAAMNDLLRPSLYDAHHEVWPLKRSSRTEKEIYDVVGPVCESGDVLARERLLQKLHDGEYVAMMSAGAYGYVMASNYNSRGRAPEVLVKGSKFEIVKKREDYQTLIAGETIPAFV
ncbi:MAG: diaminopimelate decarboxylase [Candidatus Omnitrophica bacterium]|nr:diaminopimelate decarboxylase [Candidatus Omnitrophota bacterium]